MNEALADLRQSDAELARSEERFRLAMDAAGEGLWDYDVPSGRVYYSPGWARILALQPAEVAPEYASWESRLHPEDRDAAVDAVRATLDGRADEFAFEHRLRCGDGSWRWVLGRGRVVGRDAGGAPVRMVGTMKDIDQHKRAEQALRASEARHRAIVEAQDDAVCRWLPDTTLTFTNARYRELYGLTEDRAQGCKWLDLVPPNERAGVADLYAQLVREPRRVAFEHVTRAADGSSRWISWAEVPLFDDDGRLVEFQSVGRDITARKGSEDALRRANRALRTLTECSHALSRAADERQLLNEVCRLVVVSGGYRMAWVGFAEHDEGRSVWPAAAAGLGRNYLESIRISWGDNPLGRGPTGTAIRERRPAIARDIATDPQYAPWREPARQHGYASSIALPLLADNGACLGALNIYSAEPNVFDKDEASFLAELAGELAYGIRALRDRTARDHAEARLRLALEAARQGIYDLNVQTGEAEVSPEYATMLGYDPAVFKETNAAWIDRLHPDDREAVAATYRDYVAGKLPAYRVEFRQRTRSGEWKWILSLGRIVQYDTDGAPLRMLGTHTDITERKNAEAALRELNQTLEARVRSRTAELQQTSERAEKASRAKSEFLSHMSHELRTPLNAILGFAQILEFSNPTEKQRGWAQEIYRAGDHLLQLIEELLDLSRIEVGKMTLSIEPVVLGAVVREAINIVQPTIDGRDIRVEHQEYAPSLAAHADRTRLRQILVNYLSNAAKFNRDGGRIIVACNAVDDKLVRLTVTDTGAGIAPDKLASLFQPFERLDAKTRGIEGTGIGLALSKQLAELMGATVGAKSTLGQGSTFWVDLPLATAPVSSQQPPPPAPLLPANRLITVLYVEDNPSNLAVVRTFLEPYPHIKLYTTADGSEGLAIARGQRPDLVLLDIHMPQMDGFTVLRKLRADPETRTIPVVALSADALPDEIVRGMAAGFARYLVKPVSLQALLQVITEFSAQPDSP